jgi:hypothetical protein
MRPIEIPLESELAGLDALDRPIAAHPGLARRTWRGLWPKLAAIGIAVPPGSSSRGPDETEICAAGTMGGLRRWPGH